MLDLIREAIGWARAYVLHAVVMFYWAWIPGILGAALLGARYRPRLEAIARKPSSTARGVSAAIGWGMLSGAGRKASLATAGRLREQGVAEPVVLNPLTIRALLCQHGRRRGWRLVTAIYGTAALSGLAVGGLYRLLGLEVTHGRTWFEGLVDWMIRTLHGAPGGALEGQ